MNNNKIILFIFLSFIFNSVNDTTNNNGDDALFYEEVDLFDQLLSESKVFYAEAIIADMSSDTVNTLYYFDNLFKALTQLEEVSKNVPEIAQLKYQKLLSSVIEYYDKKVISVDHANTGYSTAVLKDKLEEYIYSQELEDIIGIEETIEIVDGFPITYNRKVQNVIDYYTKRGKSHIQHWLNREEKFKQINESYKLLLKKFIKKNE